MGNRKHQFRSNALSYGLSLSLAAMAGCMAPMVDACAQSLPPAANVVEFDIPAGELAAALDRFAEQSGLQVVSEQSLQGLRTPALRGRYAPEEALGRLLQGSGFRYERLNAQTLVLKKQPAAVSPEPKTRAHNVSTPPQTAEPAIQDLDKMTVTGTRIRGGETPSPVITIDAENIREEGFTDLGEVIRSVPQNYGGGQNPGVINGQGGNVANLNLGGGSSLNLRGLGPDATLTLLNGRRLSYGGLYQSVDIGAIPVEAVQRVEIVADGASAIYGSDAVGGVGNVILKRDFEGLRVSARYGSSTQGGLATRDYSATAGSSWANGGVIAAFKNVSSNPIFANRRDYTQFMDDPTTIYPGSDARSGLVSAFHMLGSVAELRLDAFAVARDQHTNAGRPAFFAATTSSTGASFIAPSIEFFLPRSWTVNVGASAGRDDVVQKATLTYLSGATTTSANTSYLNTNSTYEAGAEGPLFDAGGGDARLAVGAGFRKNHYREFNRLTHDTASPGGDASRFVYTEVSLPLIGEPNHRNFAYRLSLTAAVRGENYNSFGSVTTPKLGLIYGPSADFTLKASWGKSFKAPTLVQRNGPQFAHLDLASAYGPGFPAGATVLAMSGANPALMPERAETWMSSFVFHPQMIPGLDAELSLFDIDYTDRVVSPITGRDGLTNPIYASFITFSPTPEQLAAAIRSARFINVAGVAYDPANVVALQDGRQTNVSRQSIRGVDLSAGYGFAAGLGRLTLRGSASWLDSERQVLPGQRAFDLSGMIFHPAKYKGRFGVVWSQGGFTASGFANYTAGVINLTAAEKTGSFTTLDANFRYRADESDSFWSRMELSLSATNLLNRPPPGYTSASKLTAHFDSTNYSAIGRYVNVSVSKHW